MILSIVIVRYSYRNQIVVWYGMMLISTIIIIGQMAPNPHINYLYVNKNAKTEWI